MFDAQLAGPVQVLLFHVDGDEQTTQFTEAAREILTDLAALSNGKITLRDLNLSEHGELAKSYQIEEVPSMVLLGDGDRDSRMRFYGAPLGYEFMVLLDDLIDVSGGKTRLSEPTRQRIQAIQQPVTIQVYTTPT